MGDSIAISIKLTSNQSELISLCIKEPLESYLVLRTLRRTFLANIHFTNIPAIYSLVHTDSAATVDQTPAILTGVHMTHVKLACWSLQVLVDNRCQIECNHPAVFLNRNPLNTFLGTAVSEHSVTSQVTIYLINEWSLIHRTRVAIKKALDYIWVIFTKFIRMRSSLERW